MQRFDAGHDGSFVRRVPCGECRRQHGEEPLDCVRHRMAINDDAIRGTECELGLPGVPWSLIAAYFHRHRGDGRSVEQGVVPWPCLGAGGVSFRRPRRTCSRGCIPAATVLEGLACARRHAADRSVRLLYLLHDILTPGPCTRTAVCISTKRAVVSHGWIGL